MVWNVEAIDKKAHLIANPVKVEDVETVGLHDEVMLDGILNPGSENSNLLHRLPCVSITVNIYLPGSWSAAGIISWAGTDSLVWTDSGISCVRASILRAAFWDEIFASKNRWFEEWNIDLVKESTLSKEKCMRCPLKILSVLLVISSARFRLKCNTGLTHISKLGC